MAVTGNEAVNVGDVEKVLYIADPKGKPKPVSDRNGQLVIPLAPRSMLNQYGTLNRIPVKDSNRPRKEFIIIEDEHSSSRAGNMELGGRAKDLNLARKSAVLPVSEEEGLSLPKGSHSPNSGTRTMHRVNSQLNAVYGASGTAQPYDHHFPKEQEQRQSDKKLRLDKVKSSQSSLVDSKLILEGFQLLKLQKRDDKSVFIHYRGTTKQLSLWLKQFSKLHMNCSLFPTTQALVACLMLKENMQANIHDLLKAYGMSCGSLVVPSVTRNKSEGIKIDKNSCKV